MKTPTSTEALDAAGPIITHLINRVTPGLSRDDEEDLRQDLAVRILTALPKFDATKAMLTTWLFTIVRNKLIDVARKHGRRLRTVDITELDIPAPEPQIAGTGIPASSLSKLTPRQHAIYLRLLNGQTPMEIARALGLRRESVAQMKRRILDRLQQTLTPAA